MEPYDLKGVVEEALSVYEVPGGCRGYLFREASPRLFRRPSAIPGDSPPDR